MKKRQEKLSIVSKSIFHENIILWELHSELKFDLIIPGQFINVLVKDEKEVFIRRPFSIHWVDYEKNNLWFMMKIVGKGTATLARLQVGDTLDLLYPLGNGFNFSKANHALLVGGGYGIAPLYHLAAEIIKSGGQADFLLGAKTITDYMPLDKFGELATLHISTEDGSMGFKGMVTAHPVLEKNIDQYDILYSCGPEPMMQAVSKLAEINNIPCHVSLDQVMGCGIGVCLGCVKKTTRGNDATCLHGPVFNSKDIIW